MIVAVIYEREIWTRKDVEGDQDRTYLFGDNTIDRTVTHHIPKFTQAVIRDLPNAIGIDTKYNRWEKEDSFLSDSDFGWFHEHVDNQIKDAIKRGKTIVIPKGGIGTGKADLPNRAPKCYEYLKNKLESLLNYESV